MSIVEFALNRRPSMTSDEGDVTTWDASLSERHSLQFDYTSEPIESGAEISDNRVRRQRELPLQVTVSSAELGGVIRDRHIQAWTRLVSQAEADPPLLFEVTTVAESYDNMVIAAISWPRTPDQGNRMVADIVFKQLEFSQTDVAANLADAAQDLALGDVSLGSQGLG